MKMYMVDTMLLTIVDTTYTKGDFYKKIALLKEFFEHYFFTQHESIELKTGLEKFLRDRNALDDVTTTLLGLSDDFYHRFTPENFNQIVDELEAYTNTLPSIVLYIPVIFEAKQITTLGTWVRTNVAPHTLLEVKIDPDVVGGCSFVYGGVYHDFSHRYFFDKRNDDIVAMIRNQSND